MAEVGVGDGEVTLVSLGVLVRIFGGPFLQGARESPLGLVPNRYEGRSFKWEHRLVDEINM